MKKPEIGDFVQCRDGHMGILTTIKDTYWGPMAFFISADERIYHCPVADLVEEGGDGT